MIRHLALRVQRRYPRLLEVTTWTLAVVMTVKAALVIALLRYGYDSHAYWLAWRGPMYSSAPNVQDAYLYSPAFAQGLWPLAQLPWPLFAAVASAALGSTLVWLLRPLSKKWAIPLFVVGIDEVVTGNVYLIMAVVAVVGLRRPSTWSFVALTKVTPSVGPVWFLMRREWRQLGISIAATAIVAGLSLLLMKDEWWEWVRFLTNHAESTISPLGSPIVPPLIFRIPIGLALVAWGARSHKPWTVPVGMVMCSPVVGLGTFALLFALPRLLLSVERRAAGTAFGTGSSLRSAPQRAGGEAERPTSDLEAVMERGAGGG